jgi:VanZ family protein
MRLARGFRLLRWAPSLILMLLIFTASDTPGNELPNFGVWDLVVKKLGHFAGYALLATAYSFALKQDQEGQRRTLLVAVLLAAVYAILDETHQIFTPGRTPAVTDVMIDTCGAFVGAAIWHRVRFFRIIQAFADR